MKILYFTCGQSPHDLRFLQALSTSGYETAVLCLDNDPSLTWPIGIKVLAWPKAPAQFSWFTAPGLSKSLRKIIADFNPDVIHAGPIQKTAFIAALTGFKPLVSMSWGSDLLVDAARGPIWECVTRYVLKRTTVLAADCQTVVNSAASYGFSGPNRVFPWGVDLGFFHPGSMGDLRKTLRWEKNVVFLCNRTMEKLYGMDIAARSFASAAKINPSIRLLLFGGGSQKAQIYSILENAGVLDKVYFGGFADLPKLPDIYQSADYYVSASHSDGSSVSLMEALACGKPAIISDIPSNREWIEEDQQGWLFPDGDANALCQRILSAAKMKKYSKMSHSARALAENKADWPKNFKVLLNAYQTASEIEKKR